MKFYSEITKKLYGSEAEVNAAELAFQKEKEKKVAEQTKKDTENRAIAAEIKKILDQLDHIDDLESKLMNDIDQYASKYKANKPAIWALLKVIDKQDKDNNDLLDKDFLLDLFL